MDKKDVINQLKSLRDHFEGWDEQPWIDDVQALDYAIKELGKTTLEVPVQEQLQKFNVQVDVKELARVVIKEINELQKQNNLPINPI